MECHGHKTEVSKKSGRDKNVGNGQHADGRRERRGRRETAEAKETRQGKKEDEDGAAYLTFNNSWRRQFSFIKLSIATCTHSCCFRRISTLVSIGISMYACLLVDLRGSGSAVTPHTASSVSLAILVQAYSAGPENTEYVYVTKERRKDEHITSEQVSCACPPDTEENEDVVGSPRGEIVIQASAHSMLVGEGFHRTMLTTVHIKGNVVEEQEKEDAEKGRKMEKTSSEPCRDKGGKRKERSDSRVGNPRKRETGKGKSMKNEEEEDAQKLPEEETETNGENDTGWEGEEEQGTQKRESDAKRSLSDSDRRPERTRGRESEGVTPGVEGVEFRKRNATGGTGVTGNDFDDDNHLVCTVTCEYAFDKIVYVDPDQTWELGLKGQSTLAKQKTGDSVFDTSFATDFAQMGSVEMFPPAVDVEAPVFASHLPSVLRVRQKIGYVLLKRPPSSAQKEGTRVAALNLDSAQDETIDTRTHENASAEESSSCSSNNLHNEEKHSSVDRRDDSYEGFYRTEKTTSQIIDTSEDESKKGDSGKDENHVAQDCGKKYCHAAVSGEEDDNVYDATEHRGHRDGTPNVSSRNGIKRNRRNHSYEAFVKIELPLHHRYEAACSGCDGFSVHQIKTPVVKVACCRESGQARAKAELQLRRRLQNKSVHATSPAGGTEKCCHQKQKTEREQRRRSHVKSSSEKTTAGNESTAYVASSHSYCTLVESISTAGNPEQESAGCSFSNANMRPDSCDSKCYGRPSLSDKRMTISTCVTELNTRGGANDHRSAEVDQGGAGGNADEERGKIGARTLEKKRDCEESDERTGFLLQVPVGSAEDLPWVTAVTLIAIGISLLATAWILGYAEAYPGCRVSREVKEFSKARC